MNITDSKAKELVSALSDLNFTEWKSINYEIQDDGEYILFEIELEKNYSFPDLAPGRNKQEKGVQD